LSEAHTIQLVLSAQAERYVRSDAPVEVRRLAATGALPLEPVELATVLFALLHDADLEVKTRAQRSLEQLPDAVAARVLASNAHPALLSWLAQLWRDRADRMELLALNAATDDRSYAFLASLPHRRVIEIVANNQTRLLRHPEIVEALGNNPVTGRATIDRILSFLGLERPEAELSDESAAGQPREPGDLSDESALAALRELLGDDVSAFAPELIRELAENEALDAEKQGNLFALVQKMNVMQKVKLARMGNKEARGLLIRDRNKIVASAAVRSPKITQQEVAGFAKARNVSDEVLRIIASNRDWIRNYAVKVALATNPKCPIPTAMKFVNHLQERDLRSIMKSRDVPTPIATHARRLLEKKGKRE
jgi:hypothetical protein